VRLGLITSVWLGTAYEGRPGLELARELGFDAVDVYVDPLDLTLAARRELVRDLADVRLPVGSVPCAAMGSSDPHPAVRRFHVERAKKHVDLAVELDAGNLMLAHGESLWEGQVVPRALEWRWAVETTREVAEHAGRYGLDVAIELEPFELSAVNSLEKMERHLDEVGLPNVKANVDCSHLWLRRIPPSELERLRGRIAHVHFSDCDGERHGDLPPGRGTTPLSDYLAALADAGFDGVVSLELEYAPDPLAVVDWVSEAYRETARLMREGGVRS
jgi:D-psicose/D-tagatose/L-ribulose 3-epimerase